LSNASWSASTLARRLRSGLWEGRLGSIAAYFAEAARVRPAIDPILKQAIESTPDGLCITDTNRRVIICNRQFAFMYGLSQNDIGPGVSLDDFAGHLPSIAMEMSSHRIAACLPSRDGGGSQRFHELPNGRYVSVSRHAMDDGQTIEVHRDVTDERWADDRANQSIQALLEKQYAIDQAVIVAITDVKGNIVYANDNLCDISGYSRDELLGQNHRILNSGVHLTSFFSELWNTIGTGQIWRGEICNRTKSGQLYWVDTTIVPALSGPDGPASYTAIRFEVTEHVLALEALSEARLVAERAAALRDTFLATMSHEVRTPLNGVLGLAQSLSGADLPDDARQKVDLIIKSGETLRR
ncbi:MAG: PAS domain S-box protein, partial [Oxalobacteraceae bacterium]